MLSIIVHLITTQFLLVYMHTSVQLYVFHFNVYETSTILWSSETYTLVCMLLCTKPAHFQRECT